MRLPQLLFLNLVLLCLVMAWSWTRPQAEAAAGVAHPTVSNMLVGGDGMERFAPVAVQSLIFGCLSITFFVGLLALGLRQKGRVRGNKLAFFVGLAFYLGMFFMVWQSYQTFAAGQSEVANRIGPLFLGFPIPTAWMLFGLYGAPIVFLLLYCLNFDSWVFTEDDEKEFRQLVETTTKARQAEGS